MFIYHWKELKYRLYYIIVSQSIIWFTIWEYKERILERICTEELIYTQLSELFIGYITITLLLGILLNMPILYSHYNGYDKQGLYEYEYNRVKYKRILKVILLWLLVGISIRYILPSIIDFFEGYSTDTIKMTLRMEEYIVWLERVLLISILLIELPDYINTSFIEGKRRILYILILILSAMLTPPDIISLVILSLPIIVLIEIKLFINKL